MTNKSFFDSKESAEQKQIGGSQYKVRLHPYSFTMSHGLDPFHRHLEKYVVRYLKKNQIEDLNKIIHYCELEIDRLRKEWDK